jgi:diguanylate cyclase (GGDEF)-like protein
MRGSIVRAAPSAAIVVLAFVLAIGSWFTTNDTVGIVLYEGGGWLFAALIVLAVWRRRPVAARAWLLLALGVTLTVAGDLVYDLADLAGEVGGTSTLANAFYFLSYPAFIAGVVGLLRSVQPGRDAMVIIDGAVFAIAGWLAIWILVVNPAIDSSGLSVLDWIPTVAYPPLDIIVLVVVLRVGRGDARLLVSWWLLLGAFTMILAVDTLYAVLAMPETGVGEFVVAVGFLVSYGLIAAAAVHPDMVELGRTASRTGERTQLARVAGLGLAAAVPAILLAGWPDLVFDAPLVTAIAGLVLVGGALTRALLVLRHQRDAERVLEVQATRDPLTGLANRFVLVDRLEQTRMRCRRSGRECAVIFCDLDQFKVVNDTHGHSVGDELLVAVADRLLTAIQPGDVIGRLGGDEFVVISSAPGGDERDWDPAAVIRAALRAPFTVAGSALHATMSIGVVRDVQDSLVPPEVIISEADIAMYYAKDNGRDRVEEYLPVMDQRLRERTAIESALRVALAEDQFFLVFQPVFSLLDGSKLSEEALLRWNRPGAGVALPVEFVHIAEANGLIAEIGVWVLRVAARRARLTGVPLAVNVSARQLRDPDMAATFIEILADGGLRPDAVTLEITETQILEATESVRSNLAALRTAGFSFAIDDFGLGHSNIAALKELDV